MNTLHYRYWLGILVAVCVAIASTSWIKSDQLVTLIGFASTISSLILAILAIFISLQANKSTGDTLSALSGAARRVEISADDIGKSGEKLSTIVSAVPDALGEMSQKIDRAQENWGAAKKAAEDAVNSAVLEIPDDSKTTPVGFAEILKNSPPAGVLGFYIISLAKQKTSFDLNEFLEAEPASYLRGFLRGIDVSGMIKIRTRDRKISVIDVGIVDGDVVNRVVKEMQNSSPYIKRNKTKVDEYFSSQI